MNFHLLALPNVQTTKEYSLDGFCTATISFAKLLRRLGHRVFLYGSEENEAPCDELVKIITKEEQRVLLDGCQYQNASVQGKYALWALSNPRAVIEIGKRKQPKDFIALIGGTSQEAVAKAHPDLMAIEYSVGYISSFSKYRVFESRAWQHFTYGSQQQIDGNFFDAVIPYFFDHEEFPFREKKEPFAVYAGRLIPKKGLSIACKAAYLSGTPLKVIGHGDTSLITDGAQYLGELDSDTRNEWVSRASALICPTLYLEPFGSVAVEAQMCGTPVISTDFGAFPETVEQGKTGFRCNVLGEFVKAFSSVKDLNPRYIRERAIRRFSIDSVAGEYQDYFDRLMLLWSRGWETV